MFMRRRDKSSPAFRNSRARAEEPINHAGRELILSSAPVVSRVGGRRPVCFARPRGAGRNLLIKASLVLVLEPAGESVLGRLGVGWTTVRDANCCVEVNPEVRLLIC